MLDVPVWAGDQRALDQAAVRAGLHDRVHTVFGEWDRVRVGHRPVAVQLVEPVAACPSARQHVIVGASGEQGGWWPLLEGARSAGAAKIETIVLGIEGDPGDRFWVTLPGDSEDSTRILARFTGDSPNSISAAARGRAG